MTPPYQPNAEMALIGWLKTLGVVDPTKIATSLPGDPRVWAGTGFVTVSAVGGSPGVYVPMRNPVLSVDVWRVRLNSEKAPWGAAQAMTEPIVQAFYDQSRFPAVIATDSNFAPMTIHSGYPRTEPRKVPGSDAGYAHISFDAQIHWSTPSGATP